MQTVTSTFSVCFISHLLQAYSMVGHVCILTHSLSCVKIVMYQIVNFTIRLEPDSRMTTLCRTHYTPPPCNLSDRWQNVPKYCYFS